VWVVDEDGVGSPSATQREVIVVDVERGEIVGRHDVGTAMGLAPVGEGVVIVETQTDGHVRGSLRDPATWEEIWTYDGAVPAEPTDVPSDTDVQFSDEPRVVAADGRGAISDRVGAIAVLSEAGELLEQLPEVGVGSWLFAAGGRILRYEWSASGDASTLLDLMSGRTFGNGGLIPTTSDGSLGVGMLAGDDQGRRLVDLDRDPGEDVALDMPEADDVWAVFLVRGQVLLEQHSSDGVSTEAGIAAYDGTTGELRWRTALRGAIAEYPVYTAQLTDGRHVLVVEAPEVSSEVATPEWRLVAIDTTDGHRAWDIALPEDVVQLVELGGHLYGMGDSGEVVALG
jgi:outer membrane protein assembly factor BamB